jgi:8-oxo-dGTP pyrophosphatase MutT (NUDIX family)
VSPIASNQEVAAALRAILGDEPAELPEELGRPAGVLLPLIAGPEPLSLVFTERHADLSRHAGEISFPGGRQDFPDEDLRITALREAEEEIGLARDDVELIGALPPTGTFVTGYRIHPFVGAIRAGHEWKLQPNEVELVLELSLADLMRGFEMRRLIRKGVPIKTPTYCVDDNLVWGATARIVQHLLERLEPVL